VRRHLGLRLLSVDHHHALVQAARMQSNPTRETAAAFLQFWKNETCRHFREEETILLPIFARDGGNVATEAIGQMLTDHIRIRAAVLAIEDELREGRIDPEFFQRTGAILEAHVRLEERIVFPYIQENLSESGLNEIGAHLETDHETAGGASCVTSRPGSGESVENPERSEKRADGA